MKNRIHVLVLLFCVMNVVAFTQSEPPAPSGGNEAKHHDQEPTKDEKTTSIMSRGTEERPLFVNVVNLQRPEVDTKKNEQKTNSEASEEKWKAAEIWMAVLTGLLVIVGGGQWLMFKRQLGAMRDGLGDTRLAAQAARDSATASKDALQHMKNTSEIELRAYVGIVFENGYKSADPEGYRLTIKNSGRTPAHNVRGRFGIRTAPITEIQWPENEPFATPGSFQGSVATLFPDQQTTIKCIPVDIPGQATFANKRQSAFEGTNALYFYGTITYEDVYRKDTLPRTTNFCFRLVVGSYTRGILTTAHNDCT